MKTLLPAVLSVLFFTSAGLRADEWIVKNKQNSDLPHNSIHAIANEGISAWIGTYNGLAHYDGYKWKVFTTSNSGLPNNTINAIVVDAQGYKWIGTNDGLTKFDDHGWANYNESNSGLPTDFIRSLALDGNGDLWIGTWGEGLVKYDGNTWTTYNTSNSGVPNNGILCVSVDEDDKVWIGTFDNGFAVFDGNTWTVSDTSNSELPNNTVNSIAFDKMGQPWIGTEAGAVHINGGNWEVHDASNTGFFFASVYSINFTQDGAITWLATNHGILKYDNTDWRNVRVDNSGLPNNQVLAIDVDAQDNIWIGTAGGGLGIFREGGISLSNDEISHEYDGITTYPNPADEWATVQFEVPVSTHENISVDIIDNQGRLVRTVSENLTDKNSFEIETASLSSGLYWCRIQSEQGVLTQKLVVSH